MCMQKDEIVHEIVENRQHVKWKMSVGGGGRKKKVVKVKMGVQLCY